MKSKNRLLLSPIIAFASLANNASADVTKANNATALNVGTSYTSPFAVPTGSDTLIVDGTMSAAQGPALGDNLSVLGISVSGSAGTLSIGATAGKALTIGSSGITFTGTRRINFGNAVTLGSNQTWALDTGRINVENTLTTGANNLSITGNAGSIIRFGAVNTLGTNVTITNAGSIWLDGFGYTTINGTSNTTPTCILISGTLDFVSMGNLTGASSIGAGSLIIRAATANYTGNTATSDKGFTRDTAGTSSTFNVTTVGQTLSMSGNLTSIGSSNNWTFGGAGNLTLSGVINGNTTVTKNDAGTLTLSGTNTYTGTTTVSAGTLQAGNANALGFGGRQTTSTGGTTVSSGFTLDLNGTTNINEPITLNGTGIDANGALVNNSGTPASIASGIAGLAVAATGSGSGYSSAPTVVISGTGSGATATASLGLTTASITSITNGGTGTWAIGDTLQVTGATGTDAVATVTSVSAGAITGLAITNAGIGYTSAPTTLTKLVSAAGTGTPTITGNATNFTVAGLTMTAAGSGYTGTPTMTLNDSAATVTPTLSSVILAANSSIGGTGDIAISAVVSESGGARDLTKIGAGTLTLSGTNTYTGATTVTEGTLAVDGDAISDDSKLILNGGSISATNPETVKELWIGATQQAAGTYTNAEIPAITSGSITVLNGPAGFSSWITGDFSGNTVLSGEQGPNDDPDGDGIDNLVEYAIANGDPTRSNASPAVISGTLVTFNKNTSATGITYALEKSSTLGNDWVPATATDNNTNVITYTLTAPTPLKEFVRLKVTQN